MKEPTAPLLGNSYPQVGPGTRLNGIYQVDQLIATGGMGQVYAGHAVETGDRIAIKMIRPELAKSETYLALFRKEAAALHRTPHEAIVRYYVFSTDPVLHCPYLAMEFVEGESLGSMLRRNPLDLDAVRILQRRLAAGLDVAHRAGVVHRDVSPDNIILPDNDPNRAKIIDFGIARDGLGAATVIDGEFAGKSNYVSPEQAGLFGGKVTAQSDIYSLGLTLAAALLGAPLDMGGLPADMVAKRQAVPDLSAIAPEMRPLLRRMLQPRPADRLASMAEVATWPTGGPGTSRHAGRGAGRRRWILPAAAVGVAALGAGAGVIGLLVFGEGTPAVRPGASQIEARGGPPAPVLEAAAPPHIEAPRAAAPAATAPPASEQPVTKTPVASPPLAAAMPPPVAPEPPPPSSGARPGEATSTPLAEAERAAPVGPTTGMPPTASPASPPQAPGVAAADRAAPPEVAQPVPPAAPAPVVAAALQTAPGAFRDCPTCPEMITLPAGVLMMGSNADPSERPIHKVTVRGFAVGRFPLTVREWRLCVAAKACKFEPSGASDAPVHNLNVNDAAQYLAWLSRLTNQTYRMLSEAEWEYAARANTKTRYWWGERFEPGMSSCRTCEATPAADPPKVGLFPPNRFGLHDVTGSVAQWVADCWHKNFRGAPTDGTAWTMPSCSQRVLRGGAWTSNPADLRITNREFYDPAVRYPGHGLRIGRDI